MLGPAGAAAADAGAAIAELLAIGHLVALFIGGELRRAARDGAAGTVVAGGLGAEDGLLIVGKNGLRLGLAQNIAGVHGGFASIISRWNLQGVIEGVEIDG